MENDFVVGATVWNFNDFNSESRVDAIPHINEKALVTADRRPKASYYYYKAVLSKEPFVSIPTQQWKVRGGREDAPDAGVCTQPVEVFANTRQVELFLNGRSLGVQPVEEHCAQFRVPYRSGENVLERIRARTTGRELRDVLKIDFRMQTPMISATDGCRSKRSPLTAARPVFSMMRLKTITCGCPTSRIGKEAGGMWAAASIVGTASALAAIIISWVRRSIRCTRPSCGA